MCVYVCVITLKITIVVLVSFKPINCYTPYIKVLNNYKSFTPLLYL